MAQQSLESPPAQEQRLTMSYEAFLQWADEDTHAEWVNGEVTVFMPPEKIHQQLARFLSSLLSLYVRFFNLGEVLAARHLSRCVSCLEERHASRTCSLLRASTSTASRTSGSRARPIS